MTHEAAGAAVERTLKAALDGKVAVDALRQSYALLANSAGSGGTEEDGGDLGAALRASLMALAQDAYNKLIGGRRPFKGVLDERESACLRALCLLARAAHPNSACHARREA